MKTLGKLLQSKRFISRNSQLEVCTQLILAPFEVFKRERHLQGSPNHSSRIAQPSDIDLSLIGYIN